MNRPELIDAVCGRADALSKGLAAVAIDAVFASIADALRAGDEVRVAGFGTFVVAERVASKGRDPRTGETIDIGASKKAKFKQAKALREALNPPQPKPAPSHRHEDHRAGPTVRRAFG